MTKIRLGICWEWAIPILVLCSACYIGACNRAATSNKVQQVLLDSTGHLLPEPAGWIASSRFAEGLVCVRSSPTQLSFVDKRGVVACTGQWAPLIDEQGGNDTWFSEGLAPVLLPSGGVAFINHQGTPVIEGHYCYALPFSDGLAAVCLDAGQTGVAPSKNLNLKGEWGWRQAAHQWGFINKKGTMVIPSKFVAITRFAHGAALVVQGPSSDKIVCIGKNGAQRSTLAILQAQPMTDTGHSLAMAVKGEWGILDSEGKFNFLPQNVHPLNLGEGMIAFTSNEARKNRCGYMNSHNFTEVIPPSFIQAGPFQEGKAAVAYSTGEAIYPDRKFPGFLYKFIDKKGVPLPLQEEVHIVQCQSFNDGLAHVGIVRR